MMRPFPSSPPLSTEPSPSAKTTIMTDLELELASLVVPEVDAAEEAGRLIRNLPDLWGLAWHMARRVRRRATAHPFPDAAPDCQCRPGAPQPGTCSALKGSSRGYCAYGPQSAATWGTIRRPSTTLHGACEPQSGGLHQTQSRA